MSETDKNNEKIQEGNPFSGLNVVETDTEIDVEIVEDDENEVQNSTEKDEKESKFTPEQQKKYDYIATFDFDHEAAKARRRLLSNFAELEGHKKSIARSLIKEMAGLEALMKQMRASYELFGPVEEFQQGQYSNLRKTPYLQIYEDSLKQYSALFKQIQGLYPKDSSKTTLKVETDPLNDFMSSFESR